jgi:hypothetical protein
MWCPHPDGSELVNDIASLADVTAALWERQPDLQRIVIKLNEGFSGEGNALLNLTPLAAVAPSQATHRERSQQIQQAFQNLRFQCPTETWTHFEQKIHQLGAIAEAFIEGDVKRSPSAQGHINPLGEVEMLSTHDQVLGGPDGQIFLGCSFPADEGYRLRIQEMGAAIGRNLAQKGALERYGVDFVAVYHPDRDPQWELNAIEINLRKGGTTHPLMALKTADRWQLFARRWAVLHPAGPAQVLSRVRQCAKGQLPRAIAQRPDGYHRQRSPPFQQYRRGGRGVSPHGLPVGIWQAGPHQHRHKKVTPYRKRGVTARS